MGKFISGVISGGVICAGLLMAPELLTAADAIYDEPIQGAVMSPAERAVLRPLAVARGGVDETAIREMFCRASQTEAGADVLNCSFTIQKYATKEKIIEAIVAGKQLRVIATGAAEAVVKPK